MTTANATTNESGYRLAGASAIGKPLTPSQMYSDKIPESTIWNYRYSEVLTKLKYSEDRFASIGAMQISSKYGDNIVNNCHVYTSTTPRHVAIHCPHLEKVIIVMQRGEYVIKKDSSFTGRLP